VTTGPLSYAELLCLPDESTAGPSGPVSIGPRKGLGFLSQPEACPPNGVQASPQTAIVDDKYAVYPQDGSRDQ
jgi:hypothetical protein